MGVEKRKEEEGVATVVEQGVHTLMGGHPQVAWVLLAKPARVDTVSTFELSLGFRRGLYLLRHLLCSARRVTGVGTDPPSTLLVRSAPRETGAPFCSDSVDAS